MQKELISVIVPFYKGVDWLCEAIESVFNQTYRNFEIIVVNDGSEEDVSGFLSKYGDKVKYKYQENQGAAVARNTAISMATGEYIALLDSDDLWLPQKTERQIAFMKESGAMWSHTGAWYWYPETNELELVKNQNDYDNIYQQFFTSVSIQTPCVIIKRKALVDNPNIVFPPEYRKGQDTVFYRALSRLYPIAYVEEPLVKVRMRKNISHTLAIVRFNLRADEYRKMKQMRANGENVPDAALRIHRIYYVYSKIFGKKTTPIKEYIAKCFWVFPYCIERLYMRSLVRKLNKDEKYIKRSSY
jgi:glycosyltransferase involved in cell wall biosynthesis